ncbi:MAG TPA: PxKF domain-containing protein [Pyrinomonadaceae bacterium]|nr:PxKF domain-containing protein [Pyrinomonadaceae bacterium]
MKTKTFCKNLNCIIMILSFLLLILFVSAAHAQPTNIAGPAGSAAFGTQVVNVPNGNFVVTDPFYDDGTTGGNYFVVRSDNWNSGATANVGAITLCSATTGCNGKVSLSNSLIGSTANDKVGDNGITALPNGNYVVRSVNLNSATLTDVGAVTLCNVATNSCAGQTANPANSLVGSTANDKVGSLISIFPNGNYVVRSQLWNGAAADVGAITFCNAATDSCAGQTVSAANSLVGSIISDKVGESTVTTLLTNLPNGNLVIHSSDWDNTAANINAGALTFCSATAGCPTGVLSSANSFTGTRAGDLNDGMIAFARLAVVALTKGNYLIQSPNWNTSTTLPNIGSRGAVTWCNGATGCVGEVSAATSLIGSSPNDRVGTATDTATVGSKTVVCTATDRAGNTANADAVYQVISNQVMYNFVGFFQPVDNLPMVNIATAGSSIPVKFSLNGYQGLNIMAAGYPASSPIACNANEPGAVIEETVNAGNSNLTYDTGSDRYAYVWKTNKAWKGTCRFLVVRLSDGSDHFAKFSFK